MNEIETAKSMVEGSCKAEAQAGQDQFIEFSSYVNSKYCDWAHHFWSSSFRK